MPIPTRARTSALGGYVTGHGNEPLRRAEIAPVQSLRIRTVLSAKACNWLAAFVARKPSSVSRYTCEVGQAGSAAGSTNALPRIGAARRYPPTSSVPLSSGEECITPAVHTRVKRDDKDARLRRFAGQERSVQGAGHDGPEGPPRVSISLQCNALE